MQSTRLKIFLFMLMVGLAGCQAGQDDAQNQASPAQQKPGDAGSEPKASSTEENSADNANVSLEIMDHAAIEALIAQQTGKVVVVDCWSTWCPPCVREFPNLVKLHNKHAKDGLACISISFDYDGVGKPEELKDQVLSFLQKEKATFTNVLSSTKSDEMYKKMDFLAVPCVFVYDRAGNLAKQFVETSEQEVQYKDITLLVEKLLAEPVDRKEP